MIHLFTVVMKLSIEKLVIELWCYALEIEDTPGSDLAPVKVER